MSKEMEVKKETQIIDVREVRKSRLPIGSAWADLQLDAVEAVDQAGAVEARSAAVDGAFDMVAEEYQERTTPLEVQSRVEGSRAEEHGE